MASLLPTMPIPILLEKKDGDDAPLIKYDITQPFEIIETSFTITGRKILTPDGTPIKVSQCKVIILEGDRAQHYIHISLIGLKNYFMYIDTREKGNTFTAMSYAKKPEEVTVNKVVRVFQRDFPQFKAREAFYCPQGIVAFGYINGSPTKLSIESSHYDGLMNRTAQIHRSPLNPSIPIEESSDDKMPISVAYNILNSESTRTIEGGVYVIDRANHIVDLVPKKNCPGLYEVVLNKDTVALMDGKPLELANPIKVTIELDDMGIITLTEIDNALNRNSVLIDVRNGPKAYYHAFESLEALLQYK